MNLYDFNPSDLEQLELIAANMKTTKSFNILEFTEECQKRGKMTDLQASKLRMSVHTFVGAFGQQTLDTIEVPLWLKQNCSVCSEECPVKGFLKSK